MISASQLYDFVQCPHRVALDAFGDPSLRDEINPFVELLWDQGIDHEAEVVQALGVSTDLKLVSPKEREKKTLEAIKAQVPLIYGARLVFKDLVGEPDLLELRAGKYIPGDIKCGSGFEGEESDGKFKKHYAYQVAHYSQILDQLGLGDGSKEAFIIDRNGDRVPYPLMQAQGKRKTDTWWDGYTESLNSVRGILAKQQQTLGALAGGCKFCHWSTCCKKEMIARNDLTLVAELGRSKRDVMVDAIPTVKALAACEPKDFINGSKTNFSGVGPASLFKFQERARLLIDPQATPYLKNPLALPVAPREVYFDIEADPMRGVIYLHGFVERKHGQADTAKFVPFFSEGIEPAQEEKVFGEAWLYLTSCIKDSIVYYYSKYERTSYKKLAEKFPAICSVSDVDVLFANPAMIDLYDVVTKGTEWPTYDRSIKTLAQYLGFNWRDTNPSGAASIEWYHRWIESGDQAIKQRILDYNEDDCLATGVVVDGIKQLAVKQP